MKTFIANIIGISFLAIGQLSAKQANRPNCQCQNCACTLENHCGCLAETNQEKPFSNANRQPEKLGPQEQLEQPKS